MEPKYTDKTFETVKEFDEWLEETTEYIIEFEDDGQDFLTWWVDDRGEVLHSDMQAEIWNGTMLDIKSLRRGQHALLRGGGHVGHRLKQVKRIQKEKK